MENTSVHKAGFVSIIGKPNVGKSTLMNLLVGERLSIVTSKAQTTRHRIQGMINGDDFQIVYSDTPGIIKPSYELHKSMMNFVSYSLEDADVILFVTDIYEKFDEEDVIIKLQKTQTPVFLLINKIDQAKPEDIEEKIQYWKDKINPKEILCISALQATNTDQVLPTLIKYLPEHPAFYSKDELTDKPERFFAAEILREKIFMNYKKEIPYSCEVVVEEFKEKEELIKIRAIIYVERKSQRGILIGHNGEAIKKTGIMAREEMEKFFQSKIFLETHVKVEPDWRTHSQALMRFGYQQRD